MRVGIGGAATGRVVAACALAAAIAMTLAGCVYYQGEEYFDPFGVLQRQGAITTEEYQSLRAQEAALRMLQQEQEYWEQQAAAQAAALQAGLPGGTCPGGVAGAEAAKFDPDPAVVGALLRDCPFLPGGAGRD
jgi:hypothetical protein